jgi:hypothetical protein
MYYAITAILIWPVEMQHTAIICETFTVGKVWREERREVHTKNVSGCTCMIQIFERRMLRLIYIPFTNNGTWRTTYNNLLYTLYDELYIV